MMSSKWSDNKVIPYANPKYQNTSSPTHLLTLHRHPPRKMSFLLQSAPLMLPSILATPKILTLIIPAKPLTRSPHRRRGRREITALHVSDRDPTQNLTFPPIPNLTGGNHRSTDQLPAVRSYETDLACLTLVGSVGLQQALTAAAADGGDAAEEHLASGMETMVVETLFPGCAGERSTVSTRLFLPAQKVKEKAKKLRSSLGADILSNSASASENILAMTFRQVVMQTLWSFRLSFFCPGTERDKEHLADPREVPAAFTVSSSDKRLISKLAEVVCSCALESTKKFYFQNEGGLPSNSILDWFWKSRRGSSVDSSICVYRLSQAEIMKNAKKQLEKFNLVKGRLVYKEQKLKHSLLETPNFSQLDKFGGSRFREWANEFVPAYKLQIDANIFKDAKLEGWQELSNNRWEVLLSHFQMVELISILDMYYEDQFTLPDKDLSCGLTTQSSIISNKRNSSWNLLFISMAGGCILTLVSILAQIYWPNLLKDGKVPDQNSILSLTETYTTHLKSLEAPEAEALCISIIQKIKDEFGWAGDIMFDENVGAYTGILPGYFREHDITLNSISAEEESTTRSSVDPDSHAELTSNVTMPTIAHEIASYQVVMSGDGKVVGFQPTSRVAVNHWASNPLANLLYAHRKLSPGLLEPTLKIPRPSEVVLIELLMSVNPESRFALARPMQ